ncbi:hypothetical protein OsJ_12067 [Oryza sativa Japonica Group]|jgi:hypothetical protein|uniref:Uncharacterized protein n=1 Tax=Oryza sativa subsp. japonica TaxID=39947 RepID=B9FA87_ORYSJ|nr:hypothetical protein OsJ_12067 [Oryza sativa Japonica Group]
MARTRAGGRTDGTAVARRGRDGTVVGAGLLPPPLPSINLWKDEIGARMEGVAVEALLDGEVGGGRGVARWRVRLERHWQEEPERRRWTDGDGARARPERRRMGTWPKQRRQ